MHGKKDDIQIPAIKNENGSSGEYLMPKKKNHHYPEDKLENILEQWLFRDESEEDPDFRQEWVAEGIEIY